MKKEFKVIADLLTNGTRVLDIGCGDGSLMNFLNKEKNIEVRGLELDQDNVQKCIFKGLPVIQGNAETPNCMAPSWHFCDRRKRREQRDLQQAARSHQQASRSHLRVPSAGFY